MMASNYYQSFGNNTNVFGWSTICNATFVLLGIILPIISINSIYLQISQFGIEYHGLGYSIYGEWNDILGIHKYRRKMYLYEDLIIENTKIHAPFWMLPLLQITDLNHRIPMHDFDMGWRNHEYGKYIMEKIVECRSNNKY